MFVKLEGWHGKDWVVYGLGTSMVNASVCYCYDGWTGNASVSLGSNLVCRVVKTISQLYIMIMGGLLRFALVMDECGTEMHINRQDLTLMSLAHCRNVAVRVAVKWRASNMLMVANGMDRL